MAGITTIGLLYNSCVQVALYLDDGSPSPTYPVAGQEFMPLKTGDVVDIVIQNMAANANGDTIRPCVCLMT